MMRQSFPFRCGRALLLAACLLPGTAGFCAAGDQTPKAPRPSAQTPQPAVKASREHLPQWMEQHKNLTPEEQQRSLESEPGFRQLPSQTQQRMKDRLAQLNAMPPAQRTRVLERAEQIEHLSPQQRQQVRGAMAQLGGLPPDRRKLVARAFRDLRGMPQQQRQSFMNSEYLLRELSPRERGTLNDLMAIEPLLPPQRPAGEGPDPQ